MGSKRTEISGGHFALVSFEEIEEFLLNSTENTVSENLFLSYINKEVNLNSYKPSNISTNQC